MDREFIEERIKELQSDNKLCFKQTSEIIEFAYRTAINDCDKPIVKNKSSNKEKEQQSTIESQIKIIEDLQKRLNESKNKFNKISSKNNSNKTSLIHKKDIINAKLEVYNKIYDMIYFDKLDLLAIYQKIKEEIDNLNEKAKNISISEY